MKFQVFYSKEKDIWNYLNFGWRFISLKHGREDIQEKSLENFPEDFRSKLKRAKTETKARAIIENFINSFSPTFFRLNEIIEIGVAKVLNDNRKQIIGLLEDIYQKPLLFKEITAYLTSFPMHPYCYEKRWYMTGRTASSEGHIKTAKHELNHFMFYYYYREKLHKLGISMEKREKLKEALAIFTNPEGNDKPAVKKLETYLKTLSGKPMEKIIEKVLKSKLL